MTSTEEKTATVSDVMALQVKGLLNELNPEVRGRVLNELVCQFITKTGVKSVDWAETTKLLHRINELEKLAVESLKLFSKEKTKTLDIKEFKKRVDRVCKGLLVALVPNMNSLVRSSVTVKKSSQLQQEIDKKPLTGRAKKIKKPKEPSTNPVKKTKSRRGRTSTGGGYRPSKYSLAEGH